MASKVITVSTAAALQTALKNATGGETILLAAGDYGTLQMTNGKTPYDVTYSAAAAVTIRSADVDKPAVFTGLDLRGASGFTFENLTFDYTYTAASNSWTNAFSVTNGTDVTIRGCTFDGDVASNRNAEDDGYGFGIGFSGSQCKNLVFENNTIHTFLRGATFGQCDNIVVRGNDIHSIRMDGLNFVVPQGALIEDNYLHDFKRSFASGDHADMIQFWTTNATRPGTDITIRNNTLDIGEGDHTQSIFMRNEAVDSGQAGAGMFYRNVLIEGNTIYNDHSHGITVGETAGLIIRNNAVLHADGATQGVTGLGSVPKINVAGASTNVTLVDNVTGGVTAAGGRATWTVANNLIVQDSDQSAPNHYTDLFLSTSLQVTDAGHGFLALPGGLIETRDVGPDGLRIDGAPAAVTPLFHVSTLPADSGIFVFDAASYTAGPLGAITPDLGTFLWDFGDGVTGTGGVVAHRYAVPGSYAVTVTVVQPDGSTFGTSSTAVASTPDLLRLDTKSGSFGIVGDTGTEALTKLASTVLVGKAGAWALDLGKTGTTASVPNTQIEEMFGADNLAIDLQLKADLGLSSYGEVFRVQGSFIASVSKTGQFVFQMWGNDGTNVTLTSTGPNLLDGKAHDVSIRFDADAGFLKLSVDGLTTVSVPFRADLPDMGSAGLTFGNPWGRKNFDGPLLQFDLNVDRSDYPVYTGIAVPVDVDAPVAGLRMASFAAADLTTDLTAPAALLVDAPAPDIATLDDHVVDGAAMAALRASALRGDSHLVFQNGRTVLACDGRGDHAVLGRLDDFAASDRLAISVEFQRDAADGSLGRLIANPGQILLTVDGDGFRLNVATADAGMKLFKLGSLGLNDTDWHKAMVILDTGADRLQVFMDDHLVLDDQSHDFVMVNPGGTGRGWVTGAGFDGRIAEIRIDDDIAPLPLQHPVASDLTAFV
jgi:PKD domain/Right handed beta helix region